MAYEFREIVLNVKELAAEIKNVCDAYKTREISADNLKAVIMHYANSYPQYMFNGPELNTTVKNIIGKKRATVVTTALNGHQLTFMNGGAVTSG